MSARPTLENKVTTGNVASIVAVVLTAVGMWVMTQKDIARIDQSVADLKARAADNKSDHDLLIRIDAKLAGLIEQVAAQKRASNERN